MTINDLKGKIIDEIDANFARGLNRRDGTARPHLEAQDISDIVSILLSQIGKSDLGLYEIAPAGK